MKGNTNSATNHDPTYLRTKELLSRALDKIVLMLPWNKIKTATKTFPAAGLPGKFPSLTSRTERELKKEKYHTHLV